MKRQIDEYPKPLVPEHLTKLTIEKLPFEEPFFIPPGDRDDYEDGAIFVTEDRILRMSKSFAVSPEAAHPVSPVGLVGVMRIPRFDAESQTVSEVFIADLRFIEDHQLVDAGGIALDASDQEEFMAWVDTINDSVSFAAFIAPEHGSEIDDDVPKGTLYGDPSLYPHLKKLRKGGDEAMKKFLKRTARQEPVIKKDNKKSNKKKSLKKK